MIYAAKAMIIFIILAADSGSLPSPNQPVNSRKKLDRAGRWSCFGLPKETKPVFYDLAVRHVFIPTRAKLVARNIPANIIATVA